MNNHFDNLVLDRSKDGLTPNEVDYLDTLSDEEIQALIGECNRNYNYYNAVQTGLKLILNSIYGAFGNEFFVCSTVDIAGGITAMCRDTIRFMDTLNESYWYDYWHEDQNLHAHLGIKDVNPIDNRWKSRPTVNQPFVDIEEHEIKELLNGQDINELVIEGLFQRRVSVSNYVDTDSLFVCFEPAMQSCNWEGSPQEFIEKVAKYRLEPLFKKKLQGYARKYNVDNIQDFELENINESVLFVGKKMYIKHTIWEDESQYERLKNIVPKGVALIKKGTPKFARDKIMDIILYIFDHADSYNIKDMLKFVRDLRKEFELTNIDDICPSANIKDIWTQGKIMVLDKKTGENIMIDGPGVVSDKEELIFAKGTYWTRKAAGLYNHLLHKHPDLQNLYPFITDGTKVKIYPTSHELNNKFCYQLGLYPNEFAPPVDYAELFEKTVTDQVNVYVKALGLPELNKRLAVIVSLF